MWGWINDAINRQPHRTNSILTNLINAHLILKQSEPHIRHCFDLGKYTYTGSFKTLQPHSGSKWLNSATSTRNGVAELWTLSKIDGFFSCFFFLKTLENFLHKSKHKKLLLGRMYQNHSTQRGQNTTEENSTHLFIGNPTRLEPHSAHYKNLRVQNVLCTMSRWTD